MNQQQQNYNQQFQQPHYQPAQQPRQNYPPQQYYQQGYNPIHQQLTESHQVIMKHRKGVGGVDLEPQDVKFATQNPNERIFVFLRRHWSENITWILRNIFYSTIPIITVLVVRFLDLDTTFLRMQDLILILFAFYSLIITNVMRDFFDWYFDPYIITNERIIHYEFKPFKMYEVKEANLSDVENISETSAGLLAGLWGYGSLTVTTESQLEKDVIVFEDIPNPTKVRDILFDLVKIAKKYNGAT